MTTSSQLRRRNHLTPAGYLRGFADDDGMLRRQGTAKLVHVNGAAVKRNAYVVTLRDGTETDTVERSLAAIDAKAPPLLRNLPDIWPLGRVDRFLLTEYLAAQLARTQDGLRRHDRLVTRALAGTYPSARGRHPAHDSLRARAMFAILGHTLRLLGGMH
jgi:hypothetical protein